EAKKEVIERLDKLINIKGDRSVDSFHRELGQLMWDYCGMERTKEGLEFALKRIPEVRDEFYNNVRIPGESNELNQELEKAARLADFFEFAELTCCDALNREESCGGHFRGEHQFTEESPEVIAGVTQQGEALRDDKEFSYVAAWEYQGFGNLPKLHKEDLNFEFVKQSVRSYQ
ncbi:MAG: fumarate reductase/succinate dehydrogenase flavoprotein subunit, partial [Rubritalea sp.]